MSGVKRQLGLSNTYYLWIAGGIAIGLSGVAFYYTRKRNLRSSKPAPPPRAQVQMTQGEPPGPSGPPPLSEDAPDFSTSQSSPGAGSDVENSKEDPSKVTGQASNLDGGSNGQDDQDQPSTSAPSYGWAQNEDEAYIMTTCAANVRSKEVKCDIRKDSMQLSVRGDTIAAGEFYGPVDSSESIWELESRGDCKTLTVTLVKADCSKQAAWPTLLKGSDLPALNTVAV